MKREVTNKSLALHMFVSNNKLTMIFKWMFQTSFWLLAGKEHSLLIKGFFLKIHPKTIYHQVPSLLFPHWSLVVPVHSTPYTPVHSQAFT